MLRAFRRGSRQLRNIEIVVSPGQDRDPAQRFHHLDSHAKIRRREVHRKGATEQQSRPPPVGDQRGRHRPDDVVPRQVGAEAPLDVDLEGELFFDVFRGDDRERGQDPAQQRRAHGLDLFHGRVALDGKAHAVLSLSTGDGELRKTC